jgi:23S rRNA pseudouridine955/2504/2580 synthase
MGPKPEAGAGPAARLLTIDSGHAGQRLDNFLLGQLKGVPRTYIYRVVRRGEVRVNSGRSRPDYRLCEGDRVRIPPVRMGATRIPAELADNRVGERYGWLEARVLHEDEALLVIDKPAGIPVHGGSGAPVGVIEALRALRPQAPFLELAHRLDRDTSGCLMLAKSRAALGALHRDLRRGAADKRYLALVEGRLRAEHRRVSAALDRPGGRGSRAVRVDEEGGREAESVFHTVRHFPGATLVEIQLLTGRTHQARVHAAHLGHPIAGDEKYGEREFNRRLRAQGLKRLFLHAARLMLPHPVHGRPLRLESPLPPDLEAVLERLAGPGRPG